MKRFQSGRLAVLALAIACTSEPTGPVSPGPSFGIIVVDGAATGWRPVASNEPVFSNVWNSLAQSFTAEDRRVSFGFRMLDCLDPNYCGTGLPDEGAPIVYNLYAGENSYTTLLATRTIGLPSILPPGPLFGDVGFAEVDLTDIVLTVGQRYTIEITVPTANRPSLGDHGGFGVWASHANPYSGGRFFFTPDAPVSEYNDSFLDDDLFFRVTPASATQLLAALSAEVVGLRRGTSLADKMAIARARFNSGEVRKACEALNALRNEVRAQTGKNITLIDAQKLIADVEDLRTALAC